MVTIALCIACFVIIAGMQPVFFGVRTYFGIDPRLILLPISSLCIVLICLHLCQNWLLLLAWFKRSPGKKKQREKIQRMAVLIAFMLVLSYDISSAWYAAVTGEVNEVTIKSIRVWNWVATGLLAIHVWQRWSLTFSYLKPGRSKEGVIKR